MLHKNSAPSTERRHKGIPKAIKILLTTYRVRENAIKLHPLESNRNPLGKSKEMRAGL